MLTLAAQEADVEVVSVDSVGGFSPFEADVVSMTVAMAYLDISKPNPKTGGLGGSHNVNLIFKDADGKELRCTEYFTGGKAKGQHPYYIHKKTGKKIALPGYSKVNDLCISATGKTFAEQEAEEKSVEIYDKDSQGKVLKKRQAITSLIGSKVDVGILLTKEDKREDDGTGTYVPTGEFRQANEADKFFNCDTNLTATEVASNVKLVAAGKDPKPAKFIGTWLKKNQGQVKDNTDKTAQPSGVQSGAPVAGGTNSMLFPE